jgi:Tfp pilus assembly protein PilX
MRTHPSYTKGVATLPTVMAITVLLVAIVSGIAMMSFSESFLSMGATQSAKALRYAEAGARDALMRVARNKNYTCDTPADGCYQIPFVDNGCSASLQGCAKITVDDASAPKTIVSRGYVRGNVRKMQVAITFDAEQKGVIESAVWQELNN